MNKFFTFMIFLFIINSIFAVINEEELSIFNSMLNKVDLDINAVNFPKDWSNSEFKIPKVIEILEAPFEFPKFVNEIKEDLLNKEILDVFQKMTEITYFGLITKSDSVYLDLITDLIPIEDYKIKCKNQLDSINEPTDILRYANFVYDISDSFYKLSFSELNPEEVKHLEAFLFLLSKGGEQDNDKYKTLFDNRQLNNDDNFEIEYYIDLIKKINFYALNESAKYFYTGMHLLAKSDFSNLNFYEKQTLQTTHGLMITGTKFKDYYDENVVFIYDYDGDDIYSFKMATDINYPFLAIIDSNGNDVYRNNKPGELFAAIFGIVYHFDKAGNDYYSGDDLAFSANFGHMLSIDLAGDDVYLAGSKSLGAGTFGIGFLVNTGGNDFYSGTLYSQGFAGTLGFGLLADFSDSGSNNDVYYAGGRYLHAPLAPNDYRSMSQGFGFGLRPDFGGGIGVLFDESGNDKYNAGVYAQGVAYWLALGILIDLDGNDFYNAVYYPQGSGIHLAGGFLYDEKGDDSYYSKHGPGQGAGHDYGVGFLVDKAGNDAYSVDGGNGLGLTNSVGIFLDSGGNDRYERKRKDSYGFANTARESGSIGLFLDIGGDDIYANENHSNNTHWINGFYGIGYDVDYLNERLDNHNLTKNDTEIFTDELNFDNMIAIDSLFAIAAEWEVGSAVERVKKARQIMIQRENEAIDYIFDNKLHTKSGLELRAILHLTQNSELMKERLSAGLKHEHHRAVSNTIYLIGELKDSSFLESFEIMLNKKKNINSILAALGKINTEKSVDLLEAYINSENAYQQVIVARSLKSLNTVRSLVLLKTLKEHNCFLIKSMVRMIEKSE